MTQINGTTLVFDAADADYSQAIDIGTGMIKVKADGTYSFTADPSVTASPVAPISATFTVTDGDGDTATATYRLPGDRRQRAEQRHALRLRLTTTA